MNIRILFIFMICSYLLAAASEGLAVEYGYYEYHSSANLNDISGYGDSSVWAVGDGGLILHYDGVKWIEEASGTDVDLLSVAAVDSIHAFAVGGLSVGACLYRDENGWRGIAEVPSGQKVQCLPSGEAWILNSGTIFHYNGGGWSPLTISVTGTIRSFSVIDSDTLWLLSTDGLTTYVYSYYMGNLTEYQVYSYAQPVEWWEFFGGDIFALDNDRVWTTCSFSVNQYINPHSVEYLNPVIFYDGLSFVLSNHYDRILKIRGCEQRYVYSSGFSGVSHFDGSQFSLVDPTMDTVAGVYAWGDGAYWALEGNSIRHRADWPLDISPIGVRITTKLNVVRYIDHHTVVKACVQPTSKDFDVYILANTKKSLDGGVISILPNEKVRAGIHRYGRHRGILEESIQQSVLYYSWPTGKIPNYWLCIVLMPAGEPFDIRKALTYNVCSTGGAP